MRRLLALALTLSCTAAATDRLPVNHVRFSPNGARVLVLHSGYLDGSGFSYAKLSVLSTVTGATLYTRELTGRSEPTPTPSTLRSRLLSAPGTALYLQQSGLTPGVVSVARYNRAYPQPFPQWSDGTPAGQNSVTSVALWSQPVPITLNVYALPSTCPYTGLLNAGDVPAGYRLTVNTQVVHADAALSAARRCTTRYSLERVDVRGNRTLLTLRAYGPGFEGPDAHPVYVAATLR